MTFWDNFIMVLHGFASRRPKNIVLRPKTLKYNLKPKNKTKIPKIIQKYFRLILSRLVQPVLPKAIFTAADFFGPVRVSRYRIQAKFR